MKHVKILGLLVVAAAALTAFAASASAAPVLTTSAGGTDYTGEIHMTLEKGTSWLTKVGIEDTCTESTVKGTVTLNSSTEAEGALSAWTAGSPTTPCTKDTTTIQPGKLTINDAGEVFIKESREEVNDTQLGVTCFYGAETGSVKLGAFVWGTPAKLNVNTTTMQREIGSNTLFCAPTATWSATYVVTTPSTLLLT